jgi:hypothetical protein
MRRKLLVAFLLLSFLTPEIVLGQSSGGRVTGLNSTRSAAAPSSAQASGQTPQAQSVRPQPQRHSYARDVRPRRHSRITKGEVAFLAAIAGTSMGIGALAGGGKGLAIGAIVGGWGAYAGHRLWNWVR